MTCYATKQLITGDENVLFMHAGRKFDDTKTLLELGINDESTIHVYRMMFGD
jgi:hypothetical protein